MLFSILTIKHLSLFEKNPVFVKTCGQIKYNSHKFSLKMSNSRAKNNKDTFLPARFAKIMAVSFSEYPNNSWANKCCFCPRVDPLLSVHTAWVASGVETKSRTLKNVLQAADS
jgi:hypothetical protein